jgi:hypothetical protein
MKGTASGTRALSPLLYGLLDERLPDGVLRVTDAGIATRLRETYTITGNQTRPVVQVAYPGERYICRCVFCDDRSGHLYVNSRYGQWNAHTQSYLTHLVKCFRRDCLADWRHGRELAEFLFGARGGSARVRGQDLVLRPGVQPEDTARLVPIEPPGRMCPLTRLYNKHPARQFLLDRGYSLEELETVYGVAFCNSSRDPLVEGRIWIPLRQDGELVFWQARYPGDLDWKKSNIRKYMNLDRPVKGLTLYNHDVARTQPLVVVTEGVTDVWKVGKPGVALLGKHASPRQLDLLAAGWGDRCIVILLDADDPDAGQAAEKIRLQLLSRPDVSSTALHWARRLSGIS